MGDAQAVAGFDRLPWLQDEPPLPKRGVRELQGWAAIAVIVVAGASYWMGANSWHEAQSGPSATALAPQTTMPLPRPGSAAPAMPQVTPERLSEVEPAVAPAMPVIDEPLRHRAAPHRRALPSQSREISAAKANALTPWPVRVREGASGRLVRIGAFATPAQAKSGWWAIVRMNPALKRLPALVVPVRSLRDGRVYYRLQMGTTSQAHSEVLCQRMRMIAQSCVVIGTAQ